MCTGSSDHPGLLVTLIILVSRASYVPPSSLRNLPNWGPVPSEFCWKTAPWYYMIKPVSITSCLLHPSQPMLSSFRWTCGCITPAVGSQYSLNEWLVSFCISTVTSCTLEYYSRYSQLFGSRHSISMDSTNLQIKNIQETNCVSSELVWTFLLVIIS